MTSGTNLTSATPELIKPLTSLRFFAALWVILYTYWPHLAGSAIPDAVAKGYLGVDLFFVLSGFILSHVYLEAFGSDAFQYGTFLTNRLARIYPLHLAMLWVTLALVGLASLKGMHLDPNIASWSSLPAQVLMMHAWGLAPVAGWNHPSWSISAEWFAYLLFPIFGFVAWKGRNHPRLILGLAGLLLVGMVWAFKAMSGQDLTHATVFWGALRIVPSFGLGCGLYLVHRAGLMRGNNTAITLAALSLVTTLGFITLHTPDSLIILGCGGLILSLANLEPKGISAPAAGLLSNRICVYLGEISFAMYMIYVPWKWVFFKLAATASDASDQRLPLWLWSLGLMALIPLAMVAHHVVELPMRSLIRRWGQGVKTDRRVSLTRSA